MEENHASGRQICCVLDLGRFEGTELESRGWPGSSVAILSGSSVAIANWSRARAAVIPRAGAGPNSSGSAQTRAPAGSFGMEFGSASLVWCLIFSLSLSLSPQCRSAARLRENLESSRRAGRRRWVRVPSRRHKSERRFCARSGVWSASILLGKAGSRWDGERSFAGDGGMKRIIEGECLHLACRPGGPLSRVF